jgi:hypothetical protein
VNITCASICKPSSTKDNLGKNFYKKAVLSLKLAKGINKTAGKN